MNSFYTHTHMSQDQCPLWLTAILYGTVQDEHMDFCRFHGI